MSDTTDNRGPNMKHIQHQEEIRELEATCEGLDSYAAVCVANVQRLESRVRELEVERDRLKDVLEKEMDHSKFLAELVHHLYGDGWERLTIHEAKKLRARHAALVEELKEEKKWSARLVETREQFSRELGQCHQARKLDYERNAALVEAARHGLSLLYELGSPHCNTELALKDIAMVCDELKAALAEVKG